MRTVTRPTRPCPAPATAGLRCSLLCLALLVAVAGTEAVAEAEVRDRPQALQPRSASTFDAFSQYARFLETVMENYADPDALRPLDLHTTAALRAFLRSLDEEADLLDPPASGRTGENPVRFGVTLTVRQGLPVVVSPRDGTPAQRAGLLPGEKIIAINGEPVSGIRLQEVERQLDGADNTRFILKLLDPTQGARSIVIQRDDRHGPSSARLHRLGPALVYLRIPAMTFTVVETLHALAEPLRHGPTRAAILDLRNNPGGALNAAVVAASLFLPVEREIVSVVKPRQQRDAAFVSSNPDPLNLRLAILVNQGTANEAEVFAATLRHHLAAKLVGTPTYGQGRVFSRFPLPDGSRLWLPTAHYQTPAGDRLDQGGLEPDVIVPLPRETERGLAGLGYGTFDWDRHRRQILETDRPLARAFEILSRHVE